MMDRGISLTGFLQMKHIGGAFTVLRPRRRYFFVMDEVGDQLLYYPDEQSFIRRKEAVGWISLESSAISISSHSGGFIIHNGSKAVELEAENDKSTECWLNALQQRKRYSLTVTPRDRAQSLPVSPSGNGWNGNQSESEMTDSRRGDDVRRRKLTLPNNLEGGSTLALSVLEEKLKGLVAHERDDDMHVKNGVPIWLNDWVSNWLLHQPFPTSPGEESPPPEERVDTHLASTTTSPYDSQACSTVSSDIVEDSSELIKLRVIDNRQKAEIEILTREKDELRAQLMERKNKEDGTESSKNKFLNAEVLRLNGRCRDTQEALDVAQKELKESRKETEELRREYANALRAAIRIPMADHLSVDILQVRLYGGDMHKKRVCSLVDEARTTDPALPTLNSLMCGVYVDEYGFRVGFTDESLAVHYMACRLHQHYEERLETAIEHRRQWAEFLDKNTTIALTRDTRQLVRAGIPSSMRSEVWKVLIHQQVITAKIQHGKYYYRNLCSLKGGEADRLFCSNHQKQINLDLLRTMPGNVHFHSASCKGVAQLQQVLRAFCLHNGTTGYCQGMNFLAATALLIVGPEDAFWFLVALTEGFFHPSYFDESLAGAQADQEVLKEILEQKQPGLMKHLEECEIDIATITLNWFIALFFDAVPFRTLLRFWDCFLLEGPKVLFRFSIALLSLHVDEILNKSDTIGVMRVVKAAVRLTYDIDGLFKLAFEDLNPFYSRAQLRQKQLAYLEVLQVKLNARQTLRSMLTSTVRRDSSHSMAQSEFVLNTDGLHICDISVSSKNGRGLVTAGNKMVGVVALVETSTGVLKKLKQQWDCRAASVVMASDSLAFLSFLSGYLVALQLGEDEESTILWELKLSDVALRLVHYDDKIIACLANGSITAVEFECSSPPTSLDLLHLPVGCAPITDASVHGEHLFLAVACRLVCLHKDSFSPIFSVYVACSGGTGTPFFDKVVSLTSSSHGVFLATTNSTLLQLWDGITCTLLFDIKFDHNHRKPSLDDDGEEKEMHISSLFFSEECLWAGTSDGYVIIYEIQKASPDALNYALLRYPAGMRLSPETSPGGLRNAQYYIPTKEETKEDEEPILGTSRRLHVQIDTETSQYSVSVEPMPISDKPSIGLRRSVSAKLPRKESACSSRISRRRLPKGLSVDSAVSVFSSGTTIGPRRLAVLPSTTSTSNISMDYDDLFEMYSEESMRLSNYHPRPCHDICTMPTNGVVCSSCRRPPSRKKSTRSENGPRLRRKDLDDDKQLVIALPQTENGIEGEKENINATIGLNLLMKVKISDRAVSRIEGTIIDGIRVILTCAGDYGDEEAVLKWTKDETSELWINDPLVDPTCKRKYSRIPVSSGNSPPSSS